MDSEQPWDVRPIDEIDDDTLADWLKDWMADTAAPDAAFEAVEELRWRVWSLRQALAERGESQ